MHREAELARVMARIASVQVYTVKNAGEIGGLGLPDGEIPDISREFALSC
jgi:hypothetical protein